MKYRMPPPILKLQFYIVAFILLTVVPTAFAADSSGIMDGIMNGYKTASGSWLSNLEPIARGLFWKLAAIEFAWSTIVWVLQQDNLQSFTAMVVKKIIGIGFFYALLLNAPTWMPAIINSFVKSGQTATGVSALTPSAVFDFGVDTAASLLDGVGGLGLLTNPVGGIFGGLAAVIILLSFILIAAQLLLAIVESYIVIGGGILFLGFGGSRWTSDIATKYISFAVATGVKLFILYLIVGVAMESSKTWNTYLNDPTFQNILMVMGGAFLLAYLAFQIPNLASSMISGATSFSAGAALGTAAGVAAGVTGAGAAVISPAMQSARGGMQALKAGYDHHRAEGGGKVASALKAVGTSTSDFGREAGRSAAESVGLAQPTQSRMTTVGGRASETRRAATEAMREDQAGHGAEPGRSVSPPAQGSAQNASAGNQSASNSDDRGRGQGTGNGAMDQALNNVTQGMAPSGGQPTTRQASDTMQDNGPTKMGSAAAQSTATNQAANTAAAPSVASVGGLGAPGSGSGGAPGGAPGSGAGGAPSSATITAAQQGMVQQAAAFAQTQGDATWNSDAAETRAAAGGKNSPTDDAARRQTQADATWNSDRAEVRASGPGTTQARTGQASDTLRDPKMGSAGPQTTATNQTATNQSAQTREKQVFSGGQVRPPNIPNDTAPQTGIHIRTDHPDD